jgi:hypothetical protein
MGMSDEGFRVTFYATIDIRFFPRRGLKTTLPVALAVAFTLSFCWVRRLFTGVYVDWERSCLPRYTSSHGQGRRFCGAAVSERAEHADEVDTVIGRAFGQCSQIGPWAPDSIEGLNNAKNGER